MQLPNIHIRNIRIFIRIQNISIVVTICANTNMEQMVSTSLTESKSLREMVNNTEHNSKLLRHFCDFGSIIQMSRFTCGSYLT